MLVAAGSLIDADKQQRSNIKGTFTIGDVMIRPMPTHKEPHEGKIRHCL